MIRRTLTLFVLVAVAFVFAAPAEAQFARAAVQGSASDPDGAALPGVTVNIRNTETGATRTVITSGSGSYVIQGLTPGTYTMTFSLDGFQTVERANIELRVGQSPSVDVTMVLSGVEETLTVTASTPMVEVTSKEVGGSLTASEIEDLPSINRSFIMFASLLPGVVAQQGTGTLSADVIFVNGQDDNNSQFNIDGAANDDDQNGGNAGGQVRAAFEAMAEFQILTSQFDAEFGRSMGGVVNAVTKSGTNEFHGVGFFYAQNSTWNSTPFFTERNNQDNPEVTFRGLGFTVGGPVVEDETHFFISFENLKPNRPVVNNFDSIGRPEHSFTSAEENTVWNIVAKIDHQITDNNKMAARLLWEYQPQANRPCNDCTEDNLTDEEDYDWTFVTSLDTVLNDTMFNNFRWSFTREDLDFAIERVFTDCDRSSPDATFACVRAFAPEEDYPDLIAGTRGLQTRRRNNSIQFDDTLSWYLPDKKGDHDIRTGAHFSIKEVDRDAATVANGFYEFPTNAAFDINDTTTYPDEFSILLGASRGANPEQDLPATYVVGLFFQDDWQPIPNLTFNLGLRWDWETVTEGDYNNVGPRFGLAWDPRGDGRTTVRAGAGRFYSRYIFAEWEDPLQLGVFNTQGIVRGWTDGVADQQEFIDQFALTGCVTLVCLRDNLRDRMEADVASTGFNTAPAVEGSGLGFRDAPYADTLSAGVEHEVFDNLSIGVDVVRTEAKNQVIVANLNDFSRANGRPNISIFQGQQRDFFNISMDTNAGIDARTTHTSLLISVRKRMSQTPIGNLSGRVSYTLSDSDGNVDNAAFAFNPYFQRFSVTGFDFDNGVILGEAPNNNMLGLDNPQMENRPVQWHRRHNFVLSGSWTVPKTSYRENGGLVVSGIFRVISGDHFTITNNARIDNDNREVAVEGTYNPNNPNDISRSDVPFDGTVNGATDPRQTTVDFSLRYRVPFGSRGWYATISGDFFNLFDTVNFANSGGTRTSFNSFLIPSSAFPLRQMQVGVRFTY